MSFGGSGGSSSIATGSDVALSNPATSQVLTYNSSVSKWQNMAAPVTSVAGRSGVITLAKADVGLGNVDNTADTGKPVSTAQQAAINAIVASTYAIIDYNTSASSWPLRSTVTSDVNRPVRWRGPSAPPTTTGYAIVNKDEWGMTP